MPWLSLMLNWSAQCSLVASTAAKQEPTFTIANIEFYVPAVTLSTQDNVKLLTQPEVGFKRTINWNKSQSKITEQTQKPIFISFNWSKFSRSK